MKTDQRVLTSWSGTTLSPTHGALYQVCTRSVPVPVSRCVTAKYTWQVGQCSATFLLPNPNVFAIDFSTSDTLCLSLSVNLTFLLICRMYPPSPESGWIKIGDHWVMYTPHDSQNNQDGSRSPGDVPGNG